MLKINNVFKSYGDDRVLRGINLEIKKGEIISFIGKSGSGKSTLLRCINKLENIDSGEILLENNNIDSYDIIELRKKIGIVFQDFNLFEHLTVLENITISLEKVKGISKQESKRIAKKLLKDMGLIEKINNYPNELSGGQKQRVAITRSLSMNPSILMLDEPTSSLDQEMKKEVLNLIKKISKSKMTLIIVTHELEFAEKISDRIILIKNGKING